MYRRMTIWPSALRQDLRDALRRKSKNDFEASEAFFRRAWANARSLSTSELGPQPYLKTTGIAIALGSMLESTGHSDKAYDVYAGALSHIQEAGEKTSLSNEEHLRGIKLACKLAEMSNALDRNKEEEKWLTWAIQVILTSMLPNKSAAVHHTDVSQNVRGDDHTLSLPTWVSNTDLAAPFEALGSLYARTNRNEYALPVLLQAVSILIPPSPQTSSSADRCRGAQIMSTISEIIMRVKPTEEGLYQAEAWSRKALDIAEGTRDKMHKKGRKWCALLDKGTHTDETCEVALAVSLFNIGILREMTGDKNEAKKYLILSSEQSKKIGLDEGVVAAEDALQRL
ncbi:hypothetical protein JOM56_000404 [Amanita muscaria]